MATILNFFGDGSDGRNVHDDTSTTTSKSTSNTFSPNPNSTTNDNIPKRYALSTEQQIGIIHELKSEMDSLKLEIVDLTRKLNKSEEKYDEIINKYNDIKNKNETLLNENEGLIMTINEIQQNVSSNINIDRGGKRNRGGSRAGRQPSYGLGSRIIDSHSLPQILYGSQTKPITSSTRGGTGRGSIGSSTMRRGPGRDITRGGIRSSQQSQSQQSKFSLGHCGTTGTATVNHSGRIGRGGNSGDTQKIYILNNRALSCVDDYYFGIIDEYINNTLHSIPLCPRLITNGKCSKGVNCEYAHVFVNYRYQNNLKIIIAQCIICRNVIEWIDIIPQLSLNTLQLSYHFNKGCNIVSEEKEKDTNNDTCSICFEKYNHGIISLNNKYITIDLQYGILGGCSHVYHYNCIKRWKKINNNSNNTFACPLCRAQTSCIVPSKLPFLNDNQRQLYCMIYSNITTNVTCIEWNHYGKCRNGYKCKFLHLFNSNNENENKNIIIPYDMYHQKCGVHENRYSKYSPLDQGEDEYNWWY